MEKTASYHVLLHPNGGWAVKKDGSRRAAKVFGTKEEATIYARDILKNSSAHRFVVHGRDGRIQEEVTYGSDPYPPKGSERTKSKKN